MSHSCAATMILSQFDCLVCDRFYDAISTMRAQMDWEPIDWFMDLTAAEIQFEFERLLVKLYSEHLPTVLILSESPVSETYDAIFDSVMDSDALDTCSTECGVPASHSDVVESQIYRPRVIEFGVTFQVLLPHGTVCNVREIPPKTGCGSPARSVDELARSEDSEDESAAAEVPQDDLWQLDDSTLEYESQLDEESGQVEPATPSDFGSSTQTINTTLAAAQDSTDADTSSASTSTATSGDATASLAGWQAALAPAFGRKVDQQVGQTARWGTDGRKHIDAYLCLFCGSASPPDPRTDYPQMHRAGQIARKECPVYVRLLTGGGEAFASFLLARWPQLLASSFIDDQLTTSNAIRKACRDFARDVAAGTERYTTKAQAALDAFQASGTVPPVGGDFWDAELLALVT